MSEGCPLKFVMVTISPRGESRGGPRGLLQVSLLPASEIFDGFRNHCEFRLGYRTHVLVPLERVPDLKYFAKPEHNDDSAGSRKLPRSSRGFWHRDTGSAALLDADWHPPARGHEARRVNPFLTRLR